MASFYILLAIFLWSSLGVMVRLSGVPVHILIFYSLMVSVIVQGAILCRKKYRKEIPDFKKFRYPAFLAVVSLLNTFTFYFAYQHTTIANAVLTHYIAPVIVAFSAPFVLKEKITGKIIFVIILASAGLWVMLDGFSLKEGHTAGIISGIVSGFAYACIVIFLRLHSHRFHPLILSFFTNLFILIMLAPFIREMPLSALWSYLFMGVVHSTIAPILYFKGLQYVTANRAAVLGYLEPVCAILFSMIFLKEIPGFYSLFGGALIILSGYLTLRNTGTENS
jgi:drug/metabolite transporter (DMT)-like permease